MNLRVYFILFDHVERSIPAMDALTKLAQFPATSARSTIVAISDCRDGAIADNPPS